MQSYRYQSVQTEDEQPMFGHLNEIRPFEFPLEILPSTVDLRKWMTPIEDQEDMSTCTANAFAGACEYILKRRTGRNIDVSRMFIYYNARIIQSQSLEVTDGGAFLGHAAVGLQKFGVCQEHIWGYYSANLNETPSAEVYIAASEMTVIPMKLPRNLNAMKTCLANKLPFVIAIRSIRQLWQEKGGYVPMPDANHPLVRSFSMHAVLIVGYNDQIEHFIVRNSWGSHWGLDGYFYIPYQYLLETNLVDANDDADEQTDDDYDETNPADQPTTQDKETITDDSDTTSTSSTDESSDDSDETNDDNTDEYGYYNPRDKRRRKEKE